MFFATPSDFWNSPNRFLPRNASRTINSDHQSPTVSSDRAIGHSSFAKLVRFMVVSANLKFSCKTQPYLQYTPAVANRNQEDREMNTVAPAQTAEPNASTALRQTP